MADDPFLLLAQAAEKLRENAVSPVQPQVENFEYVTPIPFFTDYIRSSEFKKAKAAVRSYLALPTSFKLSECHLKSCIEAIHILLYNPAPSSEAYDQLCVIKDTFPQLLTRYHEAHHKKETAKAILVFLKCVNNEIQIDLEAYKKLIAKMEIPESEPGKKVASMYPYEVASLMMKRAKHDLFEVPVVVEDLCSDIRL